MSSRNSVLRLASRSPRRRELLRQIGIEPEVIDIGVDESRHAGEAPAAFVERLARMKAQAGTTGAVEADSATPVLGADTAVVLDGEVLGKPADRSDALAMLTRLSGRTHEVFTGVAVTDGDMTESRVVVSRIRLRTIPAAERAAYWRTGEPADKAGAYAIQGLGAVFVEHIEGSHSNVVGLPLFETAVLLARFGIDPLLGIEEPRMGTDQHGCQGP